MIRKPSPAPPEPFQPTPYFEPDESDDDSMHVGRMYGNWFFEYASYVFPSAPSRMEGRPKPVQRRILHLREKEDGRYNKVANVIGHTMQYHPYGDAATGDAMVQIGQKDLSLIHKGTGEMSTATTPPPQAHRSSLTPFL